MFVRVSDLSFSYSGSVAIIRGANFQIVPGWTGIDFDNPVWPLLILTFGPP